MGDESRFGSPKWCGRVIKVDANETLPKYALTSSILARQTNPAEPPGAAS